MANIKRKTTKNAGGLLQFFVGIIGITIFAISVVGIKNECRELQKDIDIFAKNKSRIRNEIVVLEGKIRDLTRPDHISKIVGDKFGMYTPSPESLKVVLKDNS